jgi:TPR repeat protein
MTLTGRARRLAARQRHRPALQLWARAARAGSAEAAYETGCAYLFGRGVPISVHEAHRWLSKAAEQGWVDAQVLLATLALTGASLAGSGGLFPSEAAAVDPKPDHAMALHWCERAVAAGSVEAKAILGSLLTCGPPEIRQTSRGQSLFREVAEAGNAHGRIGWAIALLDRHTADADAEAKIHLQGAAGDGLAGAHFLLGILAETDRLGPQDLESAAEHYRLAAAKGHQGAQVRYGMALLTGRGTPVDVFHGESWLRRAALAGDTLAAAIIGDLYAGGQLGLSCNIPEAAGWLRRAAEAGHTGAARSLTRLLLLAPYQAGDPNEAAEWLQRIINEGDAAALDDVAGVALRRTIPKIIQGAIFSWFQQWAQNDHPSATFNLGLCLAEGIGTDRDDAKALACFLIAAPTVPAAQYWCGRMYAEGRGAAADPIAARTLFMAAAARGNHDAAVLAGEMLINGRGGPRDPDTAFALFRRAAADGHPAAIFALRQLEQIGPSRGEVAPASA